MTSAWPSAETASTRIIGVLVSNLPPDGPNPDALDALEHKLVAPLNGRSFDVLVGGNDHFICVHAGEARKGVTITARRKARWIEPFEGKVYNEGADKITIDLAAGQASFFCLDRGKTWADFTQ